MTEPTRRRRAKKPQEKKIGVIIANTGTPSAPTRKAVKKYLAQFLMDPRICPMPKPFWWLLLHTVILRKRARVSAEKYEKIWTDDGSPLVAYTASLERGLNGYYAEAGLPVTVRAAMSYGEPSVKQAVHELKGAGCTSLVVLAMYPQTAYSTFGSVTDAVRKAVKQSRFKGAVTYIEGYDDDPLYVRAIAASIRNAGFSEEAGDRLLFSYHSIPLKDIEAGDTYELQTGATSLAVAGELGIDRHSWTISYQSRFDTGRTWLSPFTRPTLVRLAQAAEGKGRLFMVCPNFSVDCLETLYDIPYELEPLYLAALAGMEVDGEAEPGALENMGQTGSANNSSAGRGLVPPQREQTAQQYRATHGAHSIVPSEVDEPFVYVPCLNKSKAHLKVLTHVLAPYVGDSSVR